ncbi:MAG: synthase epsilon chain [Myxococcaceae bacterium]|nr:synthase epsilon chain [Myxococcaceae bacterium]
MADNKIELEIVTPRGKALGVQVDEVRAPSIEGEFGVLPGHLPLLASLKNGLVTYRQGNEEHRCAIGGGFAEVGPTKCLILTDEFTERDAVDPVLVRRELADVQGDLNKLVSDVSVDATDERVRVLVERENWLAAQLELYGDPPPATMRPFEEFGPPAPPDDADVPTDSASPSDGN